MRLWKKRHFLTFRAPATPSKMSQFFPQREVEKISQWLKIFILNLKIQH